MIGISKGDAASEYREVSVKPVIYTMLIIVAAVAIPLGWLNQKIGAEGFKIADTTQYQNLVAMVESDVKRVKHMLDNEHMDESVLIGIPMVTLILPEIMPTNSEEAVIQNNKTFKIKLSGIYWSPRDPIVTISGENYHVGEVIQGHRIIEIRKTEVVFEDPMGDKVVKYFYDYMDK